MARNTNNLDMWLSYQQWFPQRYIRHSLLDERVEKFVAQADKNTMALDVGGGSTGTLALKNRKIKATLLDPYVMTPSWMDNNISWADPSFDRFDIAVARGSINYLDEKQIVRMVESSDRFIANSFIVPPSEDWTSRNYTSKKGPGVEMVRFDKNSGLVHHLLKPEIGEDIGHTFSYYSIDCLKKLIPALEVEQYGKNSMIISYGLDD